MAIPITVETYENNALNYASSGAFSVKRFVDLLL